MAPFSQRLEPPQNPGRFRKISARSIAKQPVQVFIVAGFSVAQDIATIEDVTGKSVTIDYVERRPGDPAILVTDATLARAKLR